MITLKEIVDLPEIDFFTWVSANNLDIEINATQGGYNHDAECTATLVDKNTRRSIEVKRGSILYSLRGSSLDKNTEYGGGRLNKALKSLVATISGCVIVVHAMSTHDKREIIVPEHFHLKWVRTKSGVRLFD